MKKPWNCKKCGSENLEFQAICEKCYKQRGFWSTFWASRQHTPWIFWLAMTSWTVCALVWIQFIWRLTSSLVK